ncbi:MAG: hypothetical protein LBR50_09355 [Tannerella sp.]|nr:hypothetical protein [Tannerella sp.]
MCRQRNNIRFQVCYDLSADTETFDRETGALVKLSKTLECDKCLIITYDEEKTLSEGGIDIEVIPVWKWLLQIV